MLKAWGKPPLLWAGHWDPCQQTSFLSSCWLVQRRPTGKNWERLNTGYRPRRSLFQSLRTRHSSSAQGSSVTTTGGEPPCCLRFWCLSCWTRAGQGLHTWVTRLALSLLGRWVPWPWHLLMLEGQRRKGRRENSRYLEDLREKLNDETKAVFRKRGRLIFHYFVKLWGFLKIKAIFISRHF